MKDKVVFCTCGCNNGIVFQPDEDNTVYIDFVASKFYTEQEGFFYRLKNKLKRIYYILFNKEYTYFEVIVDKDELKKVVNKL